MTKSIKINKLAVAAQQDTKALKAAGTSLHEENYTEAMWFLVMEFDGIIRKLEDKHGPDFNKTAYENGSTAYERRLRKRVMECTLTYDGKRDFEGLVRRAFERTTGEFYKRYTSYAKDEKSYDELTAPKETGDGESSMQQFASDDNIESQSETVAMVKALFEKFGTDEKRRFIMERYIDEKDLSISDLAREIAGESSGTKFNSARVFINRFRADMITFCKEYAQA